MPTASRRRCVLCKKTLGRCSTCQGNFMCPKCNGKGTIGLTRSQCRACKGTGKCPACGGTGVCPACHGTGWV
jgi:hypothetical protein